nr:unnamed protein product [Callosobruchus analis]
MDLSAQELSSITPFDCDIDDFALGSKWEKWKRSLDIILMRRLSQVQQKRMICCFIMGEAVCKKYTLAYPKFMLQMKSTTETCTRRLFSN